MGSEMCIRDRGKDEHGKPMQSIASITLSVLPLLTDFAEQFFEIAQAQDTEVILTDGLIEKST